jgi:predicted N-formylglutamate amidohydrolase
MPGRKQDVLLKARVADAIPARKASVVPGADFRGRRIALLVTCEHGGNRIPARYAPLFRGRARLLASHRGYDPGALATARTLARMLRAWLVTATVSRLLVELNRSPGRQFRQSPVMRRAPAALRAEICRRYYDPYWSTVVAFVCDAVAARRRVVHISSHSFTPMLGGAARRADVGLLYDPRHAGERELSLRWQAALRARAPGWTVRRNYPYRGRSDGLTRYLRERFDAAAYAGIELEVSQKHVGAANAIPAPQRAAVALALRDALSGS